MLDTNQREIAESQFERNQRREAEVEDALKQERARHEAAVNNMHRLKALRLARDDTRPSDGGRALTTVLAQ